MPRNLTMAPSSSQHLTENSTSVVKSDTVMWGGGPTFKRIPQKLPHNRPHFLEMVPGRRFKPALQLDNDHALAPWIRQMSNPMRITGINFCVGSGSTLTFPCRLRQSMRGTVSLVRMISGSSLKNAKISSYCFLSPTPPGCTFTSANP